MPSLFALLNLPLCTCIFIVFWNGTCWLSVAICPTSCIVSCINTFAEKKVYCVNKHRLIENWCVVYILRHLNMDHRISSCSALGGKSSDVAIQQHNKHRKEFAVMNVDTISSFSNHGNKQHECMFLW